MKKSFLQVERFKHGFSQREIAKMLNIAVSTYNLLERGLNCGTIDIWLRLQKIYKINDNDMWALIKDNYVNTPY